MSDEKHAYLTELHPLISYIFVTPIEEILERICGTPETTSVPEEKCEEREAQEEKEKVN